MCDRCHRRHGLSALQLLVLLAVLLMVLGFLFGLAFYVRTASESADGFNNLRQLGIAAHSFHDTHNRFPPAVGVLANDPRKVAGTAFYFMLPYVEQDALYRQAQADGGIAKVQGTVVPVFLERKDPSAPPRSLYQDWLATSNFAVNWMVFKDGTTQIQNITDGTSNTLMLAERYQMCGGHPNAWAYPALYYWAPIFAYYSQARFQSRPAPEQCDPAVPQSIEDAAIPTAFCDGSARTISPTVSPRTWWFLCDPADGNPVNVDD